MRFLTVLATLASLAITEKRAAGVRRAPTSLWLAITTVPPVNQARIRLFMEQFSARPAARVRQIRTRSRRAPPRRTAFVTRDTQETMAGLVASASRGNTNSPQAARHVRTARLESSRRLLVPYPNTRVKAVQLTRMDPWRAMR